MEQNLAILIDFENIATGTDREGLGRFDIRLVMNRFKDKGRILVARSYADWGRFAKFKQDMLMQGVSLFELTSHGMQDKNRADVALVVDCMELAFTKSYIDTFVVVSGDSDFTPLVLKLKELDKRVIGCGTRRSTSRLIVEACDEFIFYDTLKKSRRARPEKADKDTAERGRELQALTRGEAFDLLVDTLEGLLRENAEAVPAGVLKQAMLRKEPAFSESDLGYSSYGRFLEACRDRGMIRLSRDEKSGSYRVDAPNGDEDEASRGERPQLHSLDGEAARIYQLLESAGMEPLTPALRHEVLQAIIEVVAERAGRGLKSTVRYVHQDAFKTLIGAHPALSSRHVKAVVKALHQAGAFLHTNDAQPVRSQTAGFVLTDGVTPARLESDLSPVYIKALKELGLDLSTSAADVAEVLFGDRAQAKRVEELAAWESLKDEPTRKKPARDTSREAQPELSAAPEATAPPETTAEAEEPAASAPADVAAASGEPLEELEVARPARKTTRRRAPRKKASSAQSPSEDGGTAEPSAAAGESGAEKPPAEEAASDGAAAEKSAATKSTTKKSATKKSATKKSATKKSATKKSATKKSATKKSATKKSAAKKSATKKSAAKKSATKKSAAKKSAAKTASSETAAETTAPAAAPSDSAAE